MQLRVRAGRAFVRLRSQSGFSIAETLIAATLLLVGALATFVLIDRANAVTASARAREGATNIGREVLEDARSTAYTEIGQPNWLQGPLQSLAGGSGTVSAPNTYAEQTTVARRNLTYTVVVTPCSVDDSRDGYGVHSAGTNWCSDSTSTGTADGQSEDMKRVSAQTTWSDKGITRTITLIATFGSGGVAIGPAVSSLAIVSPTGLTGPAPIVAANPAGGVVQLRGSSVGAADMKFTVNGAEQQSGVTNSSPGNWDFSWSILSLPDGTYTIGAVAIDALGTRGQPLNLQVILNRGVPAPLANLTGGYNYINVSGTRTLAVELAWDSNAEGTVTGYEVLRGTTSVCGSQTSLATACIDTSPASSGSSTYTVKTWYRNAGGVVQSISTTYPVTAPTTSAVPTKYYLTQNPANPSGTYTGSQCSAGTGAGAKFDMLSPVANFGAMSSGTSWASGCLPPFPAGVSMTAATMTVDTSWTNSAATDCTNLPMSLFLNGTTLIGAAALPARIPKGTTSSAPKTFNTSYPTAAQSFAAGDQLSVYTPAATFSSSCTGVSLYFNSTAYPTAITLPLTGGSISSLAQPGAPTGLTLAVNGDGTRTLTWSAPTSTPAPDFYRVYRGGTDYTARFDTIGDSGSASLSWTDTNAGGTPHTYYVTTAASALTESSMTSAVSG